MNDNNNMKTIDELKEELKDLLKKYNKSAATKSHAFLVAGKQSGLTGEQKKLNKNINAVKDKIKALDPSIDFDSPSAIFLKK